MSPDVVQKVQAGTVQLSVPASRPMAPALTSRAHKSAHAPPPIGVGGGGVILGPCQQNDSAKE